MEKVKIELDGTEKNKSEIVYNNVINAMDALDLSKEEQIDYLKNKISSLESDYRLRLILLITLLIGLVILTFGLYLMTIDSFVLGIILSFSSLIFTNLKLIITVFKLLNIKNSKYSEVERLRQLLSNKLK